MQSRNWTSVGSSQQKESRLLYFGRRGLRLRTGGRELIGHPDQLGQGPGTHFSHHLAATKPVPAGRGGSPNISHAWTSSFSTNSAICPSLRPAASCSFI